MKHISHLLEQQVLVLKKLNKKQTALAKEITKTSETIAELKTLG